MVMPVLPHYINKGEPQKKIVKRYNIVQAGMRGSLTLSDLFQWERSLTLSDLFQWERSLTLSDLFSRKCV